MLDNSLRIKLEPTCDKQYCYTEADGVSGLTIHFDKGQYILSEIEYENGTSVLHTLATNEDINALKMVADFYACNNGRFAEKLYWQPNTMKSISALTSLGMITIRGTSKGYVLDLPDIICELVGTKNNSVYQFIDTVHNYAMSIFEEAKYKFSRKWNL